MAVVLKLLADREKELAAQDATENQLGAARIIRKKLLRQINDEDRRRNTSRLHKVVQAKA